MKQEHRSLTKLEDKPATYKKEIQEKDLTVEQKLQETLDLLDNRKKRMQFIKEAVVQIFDSYGELDQLEKDVLELLKQKLNSM